MLQREILVGKCAAVVNVDDASSIVMHKVAALYHEILNHSVETGAFVPHRNTIWLVFASAELPKVLSCFWRHIGE